MHGGGTALPLVAVVCSVPMIFEALREQRGAFADVQSFSAHNGPPGLLRSLRDGEWTLTDDGEGVRVETVRDLVAAACSRRGRHDDRRGKRHGNAVVRRRGWLVRRVLLAADVIGLVAAPKRSCMGHHSGRVCA